MVSFAVVITNYNYARYVIEAIDSALSQTRAPRQVIVVDDGSTDESVQRLQARYGNDPRVILHCGPNVGQLGAFTLGVELADAEVIAFLDADDRWSDDYLARIGAVYDERPDIDFVFTDVSLFGGEQGVECYSARPVDLGYTALSTWMTGWWYGEATSANSMRRRWAVRALDLPQSFRETWRVSADTSLVFGTSLLGARKYFLPTGSVHYRVHDQNGWWNSRDKELHFLSRFRARTLINHYAREMAMDRFTLELIKLEFLSKPDPSRDEARRYAMMALRSGAWWPRRIWRMISILRQAGAPERKTGTSPSLVSPDMDAAEPVLLTG